MTTHRSEKSAGEGVVTHTTYTRQLFPPHRDFQLGTTENHWSTRGWRLKHRIIGTRTCATFLSSTSSESEKSLFWSTTIPGQHVFLEGFFLGLLRTTFLIGELRWAKKCRLSNFMEGTWDLRMILETCQLIFSIRCGLLGVLPSSGSRSLFCGAPQEYS